MDHKILTGQWIAHILHAMATASDGDRFLLPTVAHLHAYEIAKNTTPISKCFKVKVEQ
jgi:hypothetical protein